MRLETTMTIIRTLKAIQNIWNNIDLKKYLFVLLLGVLAGGLYYGLYRLLPYIGYTFILTFQFTFILPMIIAAIIYKKKIGMANMKKIFLVCLFTFIIALLLDTVINLYFIDHRSYFYNGLRLDLVGRRTINDAIFGIIYSLIISLFFIKKKVHSKETPQV
jgi:hypothetical protein